MATYYGNMASGYRLAIEVIQKEQDVENNRTNVWRQVRVEKTGSGYWASANTGSNWSFTFNGGTVSGSYTYAFQSAPSNKILYTNEGWINHNSDGTKSVSASASVTSLNIGSGSASGTTTLSTIARASQPRLSSSSFDAGSTITVYTDASSGAFTHTATYNFGGMVGTIGTGITASKTWTVDTALLTKIPNSLSGTGAVILETYSGTTLIGTKTVGFTLRVPASGVPTTGSLSASGYPAGSPSMAGYFIQGISRPTLSMSPAGYQGSTVTSSKIEVSGQTINAASGTLPGPITATGTVQVTMTVTDSRGRVGTSLANLNVLAYAPPRITSASIWRVATSTGTVQDDSGLYVYIPLTTVIQSIQPLTTQLNTPATYKIDYRTAGSTGAWTADRAATTRAVGTSTTAVRGVATVPVEAAREYRVTVSDRFGSTVHYLGLASQILMHMKGSSGVGIRKRWSQGALDVLGDGYFSGNVHSGLIPLQKTTRSLGDTDLNAIPEDGDWVQTSNASATSARNYPQSGGTAGMLHQATYGVMVYQTYQEYHGTGELFFRQKYSTTWYPWVKILDERDLPAFASLAEAQAGASTTKMMSPYLVKQAIEAQTPTFASGISPVPSVPSGSSINTTVTFPSGRFTAAPVVAATTTIDRHEVVVSSVTSSSAVLRFTNRTALAASGDVHWIAIQE